ncbi:RND transporter [uncultured Lentibacter sp.]|uniref:RND transporter n=1 Tax=uncultured Lentibacter sp. TaxID=1659309 RepID=UPI002630A62E|nr:RND transporter [uncultured Lentibacter sp.]
MRMVLQNISWPIVLILVAFLGFAPLVPEPHIWEKLKLFLAGDLRAPIDIFDFVMHGAPFLLAVAKLAELWTRPTK